MTDLKLFYLQFKLWSGWSLRKKAFHILIILKSAYFNWLSIFSGLLSSTLHLQSWTYTHLRNRHGLSTAFRWNLAGVQKCLHVSCMVWAVVFLGKKDRISTGISWVLFFHALIIARAFYGVSRCPAYAMRETRLTTGAEVPWLAAGSKNGHLI